MELFGSIPFDFATSGKQSKRFFGKKGNLRKIKNLSYWPLKRVLTDKYYIHDDEAQAFADFLKRMLDWYPNKRATAREMLEDPWLDMPDNFDFKYTKQEYEKIQFRNEMKD